ncbi:MAG: TIGR03617 family F420-dependent LLM class oxidoreductase [Alphaproteobacteria bacterium]|nr:TIGR03617 family F420-dependent LLM class oxidoreductase [Alphaproteobacteria bacterium]
MRLFTTIPQDDLNLVASGAKAAEDAGYDGIVAMENSHDPFLPLGIAATVTKRVELLTGIAIAFARSPMSAANIGWDLQVASKGRFVMGLGSQVKGHNERRFSVPWSPPAPRMREYVEALNAIWHCWKHGTKLDYRGKHYNFTLMTPNFVPEHPNYPIPPVTIAAVGPAMLKVAGAVCDGVRLHPFCTRKYMEDVVVLKLAEGWALSGRRRENFEITGGGFLATGADDAEVARSVESVRKRVGFYGSTKAYFPVLEVHGLRDLGEKLFQMSVKGQWADMAREISDDVVRLFAAVGRYDQIAAEIASRFGGISDSIFASISSTAPAGLPPDIIQDVRRIPAAFTGFAPV